MLVLADRGLYAPWLYRQIVVQGWHPFLRINLGAKVCVHGSDRWEWISHWLPACGQQWAARVACFADKQTRLEDCTLLVCREPGYEEPWVIVTDLAPPCRPRVHGIAYVPGSKEGLRITSADTGAGSTPRCSIQSERSAVVGLGGEYPVDGGGRQPG